MARVALVCEPPHGGVAEHVLQLALGLPEHGHEAVVFGPREFEPAPRLAAAGLQFRVVGLRRDYAHPHRDLAVIAPLSRELRADGFALVHAHSAKAGVLGRLAARTLRLPSVYTPHGLPFVGDVSSARKRFAKTVERWLAPGTAAIICVCEAERRVAVEHRLSPGHLAVVHNGCPPERGLAPDAELAALRGEGFAVGAISVLRREKGLDVLVRAAPRILAAVPQARVAVIGDGPERESLERTARDLGLDAEDRFAFFPFAPPSERYLHALDILVAPSVWDAFPIGLLEAQACGVPQVASAVGGIPEAVVPETGIIVHPGDPDRLAAAAVELLRDPPRREAMAAASRARHAELFTVERMVAGTAAVYDSVLERA
jgi:glycosyltransferase involved in cell wall biosynthesis